MDPHQEEEYLQLAMNNADLLCSEAPLEILEACSSEAEPTQFLEEFFATGHTQWILQEYGRRLPKDRVNNAIIVLWNRACRLHTSVITGERDPDWGKPFFSDEGLYDG